MARRMKTVIWNLSGKRRALMTAVNMLAVAELYSFTTLSSFFRMAATTSPPTLLNRRPSTTKTWTLVSVDWRLVRTRPGLRSGQEMMWTRLDTNTPYRYSQNCCSRKFSPEF